MVVIAVDGVKPSHEMVGAKFCEKTGRQVAGLAHQLTYDLMIRLQHHAICCYSVSLNILGGENGSNTGVSEAPLGDAVPENYPLIGKLVHVRAGVPKVTIASHVIWPEGINDDQNNIVRQISIGFASEEVPPIPR